jgi:hypothetical protein
VHQRAALVHRLRGVGDAELHRREGETALEERRRRVEGLHRLAPPAVFGARFELVDELGQDIVLERHAVVRDVARRRPVEVALSHVECVDAEVPGDRRHHRLRREHALRPAEAAERGAGHGVRLAAVRDDAHVLQEVRVVAMKHGAVVHRGRQVRGQAAARSEREVERLDAPGAVEADVVLVEKVVALAGPDHVVVPVGSHLDRTPRGSREQRSADRVDRRLRLLAAEGPAEAPQLDRHGGIGHAERRGHEVLDLARMLSGGVHQHLAALARDRERDLALEIEVFLRAATQPAPDPVRRAGEARHAAALALHAR